jgi:DNA-binding NarL/FixJ family response regulator
MVNTSIMCDDFGVAVTVLIVDDHSVFRASARAMLELEGFDVVGEAADGASAVELARELEPELVLLDVGLPDTSGFDIVERLAGGRAKVILTSSRRQADYGRRIRRSGALGFVPKDRLSGDALYALLGDRT